MKLSTADLLNRVDELIAQVDALLANSYQVQYVTGTQAFVDLGQLNGCRAASLSFLRATFGDKHPFFTDLDKRVTGNRRSSARTCREILLAARAEITGGWAGGVRRLVAADLCSDFLEMARHLLVEGYYGPSAVLLGCVLEEHLREMSRALSLPTEFQSNEKAVPLKAEALNSALAKAGAYNSLDQKAITTWLDLRNKAAHGKFDEFSDRQVGLMCDAVTDIMARLQAGPAL